MAVDRRRQTAGSSRIQEGSTVRSRHRVISTGRRATGGDRGATESRLALLGLGSLCPSARADLATGAQAQENILISNVDQDHAAAVTADNTTTHTQGFRTRTSAAVFVPDSITLGGLADVDAGESAAVSLYSATEAGRPLSGQQTLTGPATLPNADATFTAPNGTAITLEGDTVRFIHLPSLDRLGLARDNLRNLPAGTFDDLAGLRRLSLSRNSLTDLPPRIFDRLGQLEELYLDQNSLTALAPGVFGQLVRLDEL